MKKLALLMTLALSVSLFTAGCGSKTEDSTAEQAAEETADTAAEETTEAEESAEEEAESAETAEDTTEDSTEASGDFSYADIATSEFIFSSGAGGWQTTLDIAGDGSFAGYYSDSDMGDTGDDYPDGTVYESSFSGQFGELEKVDDLTYKTTITSIEYGNEPDTEQIIDNIRYVYSTAYGLEDAVDIYFYLPGTAVADLNEDTYSWLDMSGALYDYSKDEAYEVLPFTALYNEAAGEAFSSYSME